MRPKLIIILARSFGLSTVRGSRRDQLTRIIFAATLTTEPNRDVVAWSPDLDPLRYSYRRVPAEGHRRALAEVPCPELANAIFVAVRDAFQISPGHATRETARWFGITRLAARVRERLEKALELQLVSGRLQQNTGGQIETDNLS